MKKFLIALLCSALCGAAVLGFAACGETQGEETGETVTYSVYAPDGAPALALANLISLSSEEVSGLSSAPQPKTPVFDVHVVNATTIQTYVTGNAPQADLCILPVNAASNLLGSGEVYQMLGTVTHGNLYFLKDASKDLPDLTAENIAEVLPGKTVGVIQYEQVPGLTLRVVLAQYKIPYSTAEENVADKVNLKSIDAKQVVPATGYDYYLCPEPARTTKITATQGKLAAAGDLQKLYSANGYPQAVLVAKKTMIADTGALSAVLSAMEGSAQFLKTASAHEIFELLASKRTAGMEAAFAEAQLTPEVIANCSVSFVKAAEQKGEVGTFLTKLKAVSAASASLPLDAFYWAE